MASALAWKTNYVSEGLSLLTSEYRRPRPVSVAAVTVSSISPAKGIDVGGMPVTITGVGFTGATGATIGGVPLTSFAVVSSTQVTGLVPAGLATPTQLAVSVTTPSGTGTLAGAWEYLDMLVGLLSARPAFGTAGRAYFATDTGLEYVDTGSAWATIGSSSSARSGQSTHAMPDANDTFSTADNTAAIVKATGTLTADRTLSLTLPVTDASAYKLIFVNATSGGFNVVLSGGNANTVAVASGSVELRIDSTGIYLANTLGSP